MNGIKKWMKEIYHTPVRLSGQDYQKGQSLFILECVCGTSLVRLTQGAFIAGFAQLLGMSEGLTGIISAIPMLANVFQLLGGIYFGKMEAYKFPVSFGTLFARSMMGTVYFIPLLMINSQMQAFLFIAIYCTSYFIFSFVNPPLVNWIMDLAPESIRGRYFANREMITMIVVAIGELIIAKVLDFMKIRGWEKIGFVGLGVIVVIWATINFYCLSAVKEPIREKKENKQSSKEQLLLLIKDTDFHKVAKLYVIWNTALYAGMLYIAIYMLGTLKMSYLYIMVMSMLTLLFRVLSVRLWGRFVEQHLWSKAIEIGVCLLGISTGILFFANGTTALIILPISHILAGIAWGSIGITFFNLQVMFAPSEMRTLYIGSMASISGVAGFVATVVAGFFIDKFATLNINLWGFQIGNMQIVFLVSGLLLALCALYVRKVIMPMEEQRKNQLIGT